ncbi:MurR/RpiR family transcriptional regulator [Mollicutes bacterium LVI A0078]|nr:MurR/RpiR family transcriptional regulator [Mollicutes bacterium LVI A0075]WOO91644.1 MurR/RpiR family transcriptional regulator [Mollicutes bacterium LVI A0078]
MKYLYNDELTPTEIEISDTISEHLDEVPTLTITKLAELCNVSPSKITKYAKRLGFNGYKEFQYQLKNDRYKTEDKGSSFEYQKEKILQFFDSFSISKMETLKKMILTSEKTYLFGRGPSLKVCEYYEPRLRVATNKNIVANYDEYLFDLDMQGHTQNSEQKLMIVLTVSGKSQKVREVLQTAKKRGMKTVCMSAYYNQRLETESDLYINLLDRKEIFDKSLIRGRTLFYIYLEILTQDFVENPVTEEEK